MNQARFELMLIGWVESPLTDPETAPKQGFEGAPEAWLVFEPWVLQGLEGIRAGDEVVVLTWLDRARRDCCGCIRAATSPIPSKGCSTRARRTAPTRSGFTAWRSCRSKATDSGCA